MNVSFIELNFHVYIIFRSFIDTFCYFSSQQKALIVVRLNTYRYIAQTDKNTVVVMYAAMFARNEIHTRIGVQTKILYQHI